MADSKLTTLFTNNPVTVSTEDLLYTVDDPGGTPASGAFKASQLMTDRYRIVPTVSANDLVLSLKHLDGTSDPSATNPLYFKIGNSVRAVTSALSVTVADGTNWAGLGAVELGTLEHDLFAYLSYRTASSAVVIGWSRIAHATLYSDFSATTTNEKYAAFSTAPASSDDVVVIGRFAATLSLSGTGHLWTVPTYTTANLINRPIYETRWKAYTPQYSASGSMTFSISTRRAEQYKVVGDSLYAILVGSGTTGGTASNTLIGTLPFSVFNASQYVNVSGYVVDGGSGLAGFSYLNTNSVNCRKDDSSNFTLGASRTMAANVAGIPIA
jgi:hypothetical protein